MQVPALVLHGTQAEADFSFLNLIFILGVCVWTYYTELFTLFPQGLFNILIFWQFFLGLYV